MSAARLPGDGKFIEGDGVSVLAQWVVTTPVCGCRCWVGPDWPNLAHVACVVKECDEDGHAAIANDFKRRWNDRVPRFPSDWPQMPAVEVDVVWGESERWFYARELEERVAP